MHFIDRMQVLTEHRIKRHKVHIQLNKLEYFHLIITVHLRLDRLLDQHLQLLQPRRIDLLILHRHEQTTHHPVLERHLISHHQADGLFGQGVRQEQRLVLERVDVVGLAGEVLEFHEVLPLALLEFLGGGLQAVGGEGWVADGDRRLKWFLRGGFDRGLLFLLLVLCLVLWLVLVFGLGLGQVLGDWLESVLSFGHGRL